MSLKQEILDATEELRSSLEVSDFKELIAAFLSDAPDKLEDMRLALDEGKQNEFTRCAHALKGSIGLFGLEELRRICVDLEKSEFNPGTSEGFKALQEGLQQVFETLEDIDRGLEE